jgi:hypothetical protein
MPAMEYMMRSSNDHAEQWSFDPEATIDVTNFSFLIDGVRVPATDICANGYALLARLVVDFMERPAAPPVS